MFGCDLRFLKRWMNEWSSLSIFIDGCQFEMKNKNCEGLYRCSDRLKQNKIFFLLFLKNEYFPVILQDVEIQLFGNTKYNVITSKK